MKNKIRPSLFRRAHGCLAWSGLALVLALSAGCQSSAIRATTAPTAATSTPPPLVLQPGDKIAITFPGNPQLNSTQQIHRDGLIKLDVAGEVPAAGLTPEALEKELSQRVASQLLSPDVSVAVVESSFTVYVSGAVLRPGTIRTDKPITALEAVMEAGGFDFTKANPRKVVVVRKGERAQSNYELDLMLPLEGKESPPFYLRPADIVYVPAKIIWF